MHKRRICKAPRSLFFIVGIFRQSYYALLYTRRAFYTPLLAIRRTPMAHFCVNNDKMGSFSSSSSSSTCGVVLPSNESYHDVTRELATRLNLTLLVENESSNTLSNPIIPLMTHSLHIIPYSLGDMHTYAVAIRPCVALKQNANKKKTQSQNHGMQPFYVDFCPFMESRMGQRLFRDNKYPNQPPELLVKAIYTKKIRKEFYTPSSLSSSTTTTTTTGPIIFDLTAGLAQDTLLMAHGDTHSNIHMVERHPIVAEMLEDALRRMRLIASQEITTSTSSITTDEQLDNNTITKTILYARQLLPRLHLHKMDAISLIQTIQNNSSSSSYTSSSSSSSSSVSPSSSSSLHGHDFHRIPKPDICYLDPMFPPRTKSSAVKKNMQILHGLLQSNPTTIINVDTNNIQSLLWEEQTLLDGALSISKSHVVVKRPIHAEPLGGKTCTTTPSYSIEGSINRWDVYMVHSSY